jgi:predicted CoA-binding protein
MASSDEITRILERTRTIGVVGLSPDPERDSHRVADYLKRVGYRIIPINPRVDEVLGERAYPSVEAVPEPIDMLDIFRRPEEIPLLVEPAVRKGVHTFWMQLGIRHADAARHLREAGISVVQDRCTLVEHRARFG